VWGFVDCTRYFLSFGVPKIVLYDANLAVRTDEKVGLLIPPGEGKSTIIRLLAGADHPSSGTVLRDGRGWPLGYTGAFVAGMTGEENVHNIAQFVGLDPLEMSAFCLDFSELEESYFQPLQLYTPGMRARLAFAVSFAFPASTYLADEKIAIGTEAFRAKCTAALAERLQTAGLILVASNPRLTKDVCERHGVLSRGDFIMCDSHEEAIELFGASVQQSGADQYEDEVASFDVA
jgi:capsular polysaccharide transport system ATP-binding protein